MSASALRLLGLAMLGEKTAWENTGGGHEAR